MRAGIINPLNHPFSPLLRFAPTMIFPMHRTTIFFLLGALLLIPHIVQAGTDMKTLTVSIRLNAGERIAGGRIEFSPYNSSENCYFNNVSSVATSTCSVSFPTGAVVTARYHYFGHFVPATVTYGNITYSYNKYIPGKLFGWGGACNDTSGFPECTVTMDSDKTLDIYSREMFEGENINVWVKVIGDGKVTSVPAGISCPPTCEGQFVRPSSGISWSQVPYFIQTPLNGSVFLGWETVERENTTLGCYGPGWEAGYNTYYKVNFPNSACLLLPSRNYVVMAKFGKTKITVALDGVGRVVSTPAGIDCPNVKCSADFGQIGGTVSLAATTNQGTFLGWSLPCLSAFGICELPSIGDSFNVKAYFNNQITQSSAAISNWVLDPSSTVTGSNTFTGPAWSMPTDPTFVERYKNFSRVKDGIQGNQVGNYGLCLLLPSRPCTFTYETTVNFGTSRLVKHVKAIAPAEGMFFLSSPNYIATANFTVTLSLLQSGTWKDVATYSSPMKNNPIARQAIDTKTLLEAVGSWSDVTQMRVRATGSGSLTAERFPDAKDEFNSSIAFAIDEVEAWSDPANTITIGNTYLGDGRIISSPPGMDCDTSKMTGYFLKMPQCIATYPKDSEVTLIPIPGLYDGYQAVWHWADIQNANYRYSTPPCPGQKNCTVKASTNLQLAVDFSAKWGSQLRSVSVVVHGAGHVAGLGINCPPVCSSTFINLPPSLTAYPDAGASFEGWSGGCPSWGGKYLFSFF